MALCCLLSSLVPCWLPQPPFVQGSNGLQSLVLRELNGECISCGADPDSLGISAQSVRVSEGEWKVQCVCSYERFWHTISSLSLGGKRYVHVSNTDTALLAVLLFLILALVLFSFYGSWAVRGPMKYVPNTITLSRTSGGGYSKNYHLSCKK